jgi:hypothetical protein
MRGDCAFSTTGANVTVVAAELATRYVASAALVTVSTQVPALVACSWSPVIQQPAVPVFVTP